MSFSTRACGDIHQDGESYRKGRCLEGDLELRYLRCLQDISTAVSSTYCNISIWSSEKSTGLQIWIWDSSRYTKNLNYDKGWSCFRTEREEKGNNESKITRGKENLSSRRGDKRAQQHTMKNISSRSSRRRRALRGKEKRAAIETEIQRGYFQRKRVSRGNTNWFKWCRKVKEDKNFKVSIRFSNLEVSFGGMEEEMKNEWEVRLWHHIQLFHGK